MGICTKTLVIGMIVMAPIVWVLGESSSTHGANRALDRQAEVECVNKVTEVNELFLKEFTAEMTNKVIKAQTQLYINVLLKQADEVIQGAHEIYRSAVSDCRI